MIKSSKRTASKRGAEQRHADTVRETVILRDGGCRAACKGVGSCKGVLAWAHLWDKRRCFTRKMDPIERHSSAWTALLCTDHHIAYDAHRFEMEPLDADAGADGRLRFSGMGHVVEEP